MNIQDVKMLPDTLFRAEAVAAYGPHAAAKPQQLAFDREMAELAEKMILEVQTLFDDQGVDLDFSEESLAELDTLVSQLWPQAVQPEAGGDETTIEPDALDAIVSNWGAYLGETLRENIGGEWVFRKDLEHASVYFPRTGLEAFPFHKVRRRFQIGATESLEGFYSQVLASLDNA